MGRHLIRIRDVEGLVLREEIIFTQVREVNVLKQCPSSLSCGLLGKTLQ